MLTDRATVLLADDEETLRNNLAQVLQEEGFDVIACPDGKEALRVLESNGVDALITDLRMPGVCGMDLIKFCSEQAPDTSVIVITAFGEVETAVEAMKMGVRDYICKPLIFDEVIFKLKQLLAQSDVVKQNKVLKEQIKQTHGDTGIIGHSESIREIVGSVQRVSHTISNVLICGESGTGKEVLARAIHYSGVTAEKPFIAVNCGGLAASLVESELFGYRKGAFTGADNDRTGYIEAANGGTLFLDEISNLPYRSQAVLLRAIEQKAVIRVGDSRPRPVRIRIIAASNRNLLEAIEAGDFREDLYFRLNVIHMNLPPLRDRPEDIPLLVDHFVRKYNEELNLQCPGFSDECLEAMRRYNWRGNIRELENVVERALIFSDEEHVQLKELSIPVGGAGNGHGNGNGGTAELKGAVREFERRHISRMLEQFSGNKIETADALGIGLSSLYRKMEELGISKAAAKSG